MEVKCSRDGVADVNGIVDGVSGACNSSTSENTAGLIAL